MNRVELYRSYAAECVRLARQATNPTDKTLLLEMADKWMRMAQRAEAATDAADDAAEDE
jgi:hypothetical protein